MTKYIFVSGGVISGLGKGIATASMSLLLKSRGFKVTALKCDPYVNVDAGTLNPMEHGEVFVLDDGTETDQDLGHYERFLDSFLDQTNYMTTGRVYQSVIERERNLEYDGRSVEVVPHIPQEIIRRIKLTGVRHKAEIVLIEIGGTVGEYQNVLFLEAARMMKLASPADVIHIHLAYLPTPPSIGEMKSKPVQTSVRLLNSVGIQPDFILARAENYIDKKRREKIAVFCGLLEKDVISAPDVSNIYQIPLNFESQDLSSKILKKLHLKPRRSDLGKWQLFVKKANNNSKAVKIALVGKYFSTGDYTLSDSYISVIESLRHASFSYGLTPQFIWVDSEKIEREGLRALASVAGIVVPGGFGDRGVEGIIAAIKFAREGRRPFLGLCFGLQLATVEFARNVAGLGGAHSTEIDPKTPYPVIHVMPDQEKKLLKKEYGASMRLGSWECRLKEGTAVKKAYGKSQITERHRHRYEFNNGFRERLAKKGLRISGTTPDDYLVEFIELADHPFFIGTQAHPEFKSRPLSPHPLYREFIRASSG